MSYALEPIWLETLKAALTPLVAVVATTVAFWQWKTARQKLVLDLFEKRMEIVRLVEQACLSIMQHGNVRNEVISDLSAAILRARFLFGPNVKAGLDVLWRDAIWMQSFELRYKTTAEKASLEDRQKRFYAAANEFLSGAPFVPYMKLDIRIS